MFCTNCGSKNPDESRFCQVCGTKLEQAQELIPSQPQDPVPTVEHDSSMDETTLLNQPNPYEESSESAPVEKPPIQPQVMQPMGMPMQPMEQPIQPQGKPKKKNIAGIIIAIVLAVVLLFGGGIFAVYHFVLSDSITYSSAVKLYEAGDYDEALEKFSKISDYKDSQDKIDEINYSYAISAYFDNDYALAYELFANLGDFWDSVSMADLAYSEMKYEEAVSLEESGDYEGALDIYLSLGYHNDCQERAEYIQNSMTLGLLDEGKSNVWILDIETYSKLNPDGYYDESYEVSIILDAQGTCTVTDNGDYEDGIYEMYDDSMVISLNNGYSLNVEILTSTSGDVYFSITDIEEESYFLRSDNTIPAIDAFPDIMEAYNYIVMENAQTALEWFIEFELTGNGDDDTFKSGAEISYIIIQTDSNDKLMVKVNNEFRLYAYYGANNAYTYDGTPDEMVIASYQDYMTVVDNIYTVYEEETEEEVVETEESGTVSSSTTETASSSSSTFSGTYYDSSMSGDFQPYITFNSDGTYTMSVNVYEGMGESKGTFVNSNSTITCTVSSINFGGFIGDEITVFTFTIDGDNLVYQGTKMGTTDPGNVFMK